MVSQRISFVVTDCTKKDSNRVFCLVCLVFVLLYIFTKVFRSCQQNIRTLNHISQSDWIVLFKGSCVFLFSCCTVNILGKKMKFHVDIF